MADEIGTHHSNPHGHWERWEIVGFHDRILALFNRGYYSDHHAEMLPNGWWAQPEVRRIRDEMIAWVRARMGTGLCFGFKDPRAARLMPVWNDVFAQTGWSPRYIFCQRDPDQVIRSIKDRDETAIKVLNAEYRWLIYTAAALRGIGTAPVCIVSYDDWFTDASANLVRLHAFLATGAALTTDIVHAVDRLVDPTARHDRRDVVRSGSATRNLHRAIGASAEAGRFSDEALRLADGVGALEPVMSAMHERTVAAHELTVTVAQIEQDRDAIRQQLESERARAATLEIALAEAKALKAALQLDLEAAQAERLRIEDELMAVTAEQPDLNEDVPAGLNGAEAVAADAPGREPMSAL